MVFSLRPLPEPPFCLLDRLFEIYFGSQFCGLGNYPSHLCWDRWLALFKRTDRNQFSIRDCSLRSGEWIDQLWGYESFKRSIDGRWICHSGCHSGIRVPPCGKKDEKGSGSLLLHLPCLFNSWIDPDSFLSYFSKTILGIFTVYLSLSLCSRPRPSTDWPHDLQLGTEIPSGIHGGYHHFRRTHWVDHSGLLYFGGRTDDLENHRGYIDLCGNFDCSEKENQILSHFDKFI